MGEESTVRLLVVEDSATLADALLFAFGFEDGIEPVGVAATVEQALEMVVAEKPDVVLMDVRLPDGSGIAAVSQVVALRPETPVIIMTAHADHLVALEAAEAGAAGFLLKDVRITKIVGGVRLVVAGGLAVDPAVLQSVLNEAQAGGPDASSVDATTPALTAAEREIITLLADGLDRPAIAGRLGLDENQVDAIMAAVRARLGARSNLEAVVVAARARLFRRPDQGSTRISNR